MKIILKLLFLILLLIGLYFLFRNKNHISILPSLTSSTHEIKLQADQLYQQEDVGKAMNYYLTSGKEGDINSLFQAAQIYRFGEGDENDQNQLQDQHKAKIIYTHIAKNGNREESNRAKMYLQDLYDEENEERKKQQTRLRGAIRTSNPIYSSVFIHPQPQKIQLRTEEKVNRGIQDFNLNLETAILNDILAMNLVRRTNLMKEKKEIPTIILNDKQNVHSSQVVRSVKAALNTLPQGNNVLIPRMLLDIENIINNYSVEQRRPDALLTFNKIQQNTENLSAFQMSEINILAKVWSRINDPINADRRNDLINSLVEQLADGAKVCAMGRATRILQTLEGIDRNNSIIIKPEWAIKEEISNLTSKMYNDLLNNSTIDVKEAVTAVNPTLEQEGIFNKFKEEYKNNLKAKMKADYEDNGLLTPNYVDGEIDTAVNAI